MNERHLDPPEDFDFMDLPQEDLGDLIDWVYEQGRDDPDVMTDYEKRNNK